MYEWVSDLAEGCSLCLFAHRTVVWLCVSLMPTAFLSWGLWCNCWSCLCFSFPRRQLFIQCLQPLFTSISSSCFFSPFPLHFVFPHHYSTHLTSNGVHLFPYSSCATGVCAMSVSCHLSLSQSPLCPLHLRSSVYQVRKFTSTHLDVFVIGFLDPHCSAQHTVTWATNDKDLDK